MFISFSLLWLSSCDAMVLTPTEPSETAAILPTTTQIPTETPTPFLTPTIAPTSSPTSISCSELLSPENNATLPKTGKIHFSWSAFPTATLYRLEIVPPIGQVIVFNTEKTSRDQYIEAIWMGGNFQWHVSVLDSAGNKVCMSNKFTFNKPEYAPPPPPSGGKAQTGDACHPGVIVSYGQGEPFADPPGSQWICQDAFGYDDCGTAFWQGRTCGGN